jgi:acetyltransferase-like isoleucine patch superfamily enzyme
MIRDHRPYIVKKSYLKFQKFYVRHFLRPQLERLGQGYSFMRPWHVELFGTPISIGNYSTVIATPDKKIRLSVWPDQVGKGFITIGSYCLVCPGVRISSASGITIADNCMIANGAYITDSDWHGIYDRLSFGKASPVTIEKNVWIGDSAIVCKGVTIGENSIIGAGSIVVDSIPKNCVAAGNPARVVKTLDSTEGFTTRSEFFSDPAKLAKDFVAWEQAVLQGNSFFGWIRHMLFPLKGD